MHVRVRSVIAVREDGGQEIWFIIGLKTAEQGMLGIANGYMPAMLDGTTNVYTFES